MCLDNQGGDFFWSTFETVQFIWIDSKKLFNFTIINNQPKIFNFFFLFLIH